MDAGLGDIVAAETVLSEIDGLGGRLIVRGQMIEDLAGRVSFEEMAHGLWAGFFEDVPPAEDLRARLGEARMRAFRALRTDWGRLGALPATEALRAALCLVADGHNLQSAIDLTATAGVATAAIARIARGGAPAQPDARAGHAADLLAMMRGHGPPHAETRALDTYLVTVADHGLNASTFAARVVASTQAGLGSAVIGGLCALKGPLHGGAPGPVLDMFDAIGAPENAAAWIDDALDRGERLMGFGHRIYKVRDPRADVLKRAAAGLPQTLGRLAFAERIESEALLHLAASRPDRRLDTNVEFYTAVLLEALGIPREAFTGIFACGRILGWVAHAREQLATKRIVRPRSVYAGPMPGAPREELIPA